MTPFWDPNFSPSCGQLAAPYLFAYGNSGPKFKILHSDKSPRSCLLSCEPFALPWLGKPTVGMTPFLVILAS